VLDLWAVPLIKWKRERFCHSANVVDCETYGLQHVRINRKRREKCHMWKTAELGETRIVKGPLSIESDLEILFEEVKPAPEVEESVNLSHVDEPDKMSDSDDESWI